MDKQIVLYVNNRVKFCDNTSKVFIKMIGEY